MNFHSKSYDLTDCDREPIHLIQAIQGFGGLLVVNSDWVIVQRSINCHEVLGLDTLPDIGTPLSSLIIPRALDELGNLVEKIDVQEQVQRIFGLRLVSGGPMLDCAVHESDRNLVMEFEPHAENDYIDHLSIIGPTLSRLESIRQPQQLFDTAAKTVRQMLGYDRVMVYRFHPDGSGEVVAEDKQKEVEPFLGLRFPSFDIPQQARELFVRNRFRVIANTDEDQVPIEPAQGTDGEPVDLSMSILRAHSQMHVKYMQNMGVKASLAIAIVRHGQLWGMFACHHNEPRLPAYSLRTVAEMFSQMFSLMLDRMLIGQSEDMRARGQRLHDQLMMRLAGGAQLADNLPMLEKVMGDIIEHDGVSVYINGDYRSDGAAPEAGQFEALLPQLAASPTSTIIASTCLREQIESASEFSDHVPGALIIPISRNPRDYLAFWRKPLTKKVRWAGKPAKEVTPGTDRWQPRSSFSAWSESVEGRSDEWSHDTLLVAESLRVTLLEIILRMTDEASRERKRAQEQQELLIAELNHRVRNILNLIRSLVSQSQDDALSVSGFASIIGGRIAALASAHDNITRENWAPAPLSALFETEMGAYLNEKRERFVLNGEEVLIKPEAYTVLALVVHELVTNSAKHGSLCDSTGRLRVDISKTRTGDLEIKWRERGGPPVKPPTRRGFGSTIIERSIPFELKGEADLRFKLAGLEADFLVPARYIETVKDAPDGITHSDRGLETRSPDRSAGATQSATVVPKHVLVVEDSMIIALDTEESLKRLGVKSVQVESSVSGALSSIEKRKPDFAILDFNLGTESSSPVAAALAENNVRFVLATGYSEIAQELDEMGASALLRKPYGRDELEEALIMRG